jgi:hypothetical protein
MSVTGRIPASHAPARELIPEIPETNVFPQNKSRDSEDMTLDRTGDYESFPETTRSRFYD